MFIDLLESAGDRFLRLDSQVFQSLKELSGKVICIDLTGFGKRLYLLPNENGIALRDSWTEDPDVMLSGSTLTFAQLGLRGLNPDLFTRGKLTIEGDIELGQRFQQIIESVDIDWEELLSEYVGDISAHQIGNIARTFADWQRNVRSTVEQNLSEYLQEEARVLAPESRVSRFTSAVDELRSAVDRLEQRVQRLQSAVL